MFLFSLPTQQKLLLFMLTRRQIWIPNIRGTFKTF